MANVDNKRIRQQCNVMNDAWNEGAKSVTFNGITQADFETAINSALADDQAIEDLEIELKMKRDVRDDKYKALDQQRSKVGMGVAGSPDYGNDSPLYGAMGFVRKSEKKSGLTRKKKPTE